MIAPLIWSAMPWMKSGHSVPLANSEVISS